MEKLFPHPSREELSAYSLGQLPEERAVAIDSHISACEPCCATIVELSSEDTFAGLLQEAGRLPTDLTAAHDGLTSESSSNPDDIPPPLTEHSRYEVLGLIGRGGMGDVYKARHRKMERTVALKVINRGLVRKAEAIDRFHREVKAAAQLSHPNIVTAYDADQAGDFHFMVMEYVDGVDFSQTVKVHGALPVADACEYVRQAALGLQHAHECGMVHRDIKPHNLMVTAEGIIKILDFGLASLAPESIPASDSAAAGSDLTAAGAIMGTPDFISPEQAQDARQVDIRSDIYSLGATLYYLLSGRVPFDDGSVMHKLRSHAQVEPAPLNSVRDDVPQELVAIASKMMAKDPEERYLTPKEVADALGAFLRTWQPDGANSQGQLTTSGGSMSGSGPRQLRVGEAGWDWRSAMASVLLAIACIPVALISYEAWNFSAEFSDLASLASRVKAYMFAALCLSTLAGIAFALHSSNLKLRQSNGRVSRFFGMKASQALAVLAVLIAGCIATVSYYAQVSSIEGIGQEYRQQSTQTKVPQPSHDDRSLASANSQPGHVDLPGLALSPDITSLVWVDLAKITTEKIDQSLAGLLGAAPPEKMEWAREVIEQGRRQGHPGFAALEKGIEAGIEVLVMGERTNPANAVAADVEEALDFVQNVSTAIEGRLDAADFDVEDFDAEDFDAERTVPAEHKPGQLFVRMRPDDNPEDAIAIMVETFMTEAGVIPDSEDAQALEEVKAMEFVEIGENWFTTKGEELPQPGVQALNVSPFVKALEKHQGAAIRFAWLMDEKTRAEFDQAQFDAGPLSFGSPWTSLRAMQSTSGGIWLGREPQIALDMEFANQEDAQLFKATFDKLVSSVGQIAAFDADDSEKTLQAAQTRDALSLLFLDRDQARLTKALDIALLQRMTVAGLPWTRLFEPDSALESDRSDVVANPPAGSVETPAEEQRPQDLENGR